MDLLQGHYISSVSREIEAPIKAGLLENYVVGTILLLLEIALLQMESSYCDLLTVDSIALVTSQIICVFYLILFVKNDCNLQ